MAEPRHPRLAATLRYLRIAFSATCGILCLLLIVLWVRSSTVADWVIGPLSPRNALVVESVLGKIGIGIVREDSANLEFHSEPIPPELYNPPPDGLREILLGFEGGQTSIGWVVRIPMWSTMLLFAALATLPWYVPFRWRFSLRTLLIAMTLVAILLGAIVVSMQ